MFSPIAFLARLVTLKFTTLFMFVLLSLYTPRTTLGLLDGAGEASRWLAAGTEGSLQSLGDLFGDASILIPRKGAVELAMRYVGVEKVLLFIGLAITLYVAWRLLIGGVRVAWRRGSPRARKELRLPSGPPPR